MLTNIVIVGRPNVGKSTLFNTLLGKKEAITGDEFGLTRDYQTIKCEINDLEFNLIDTAGFNSKKDQLNIKLNEQIKRQIALAEIVFFVVDSSNNLTSEDKECWNVLRKSGKEIILLANKSELKRASDFLYQLNEFGSEYIEITALNKNSLNALYQVLKYKLKNKKKIPENPKEVDNYKNIRISIVGQPNVGKSSLYNLIYGSDRVVTAPLSGTTRDSILSITNYKEYSFEIIDTAGLRRKKKISEDLEKASAYYSRKEIRYANCVILVVDVQKSISSQDIFLSNYIIKEGRSILLIFNKWDLIKNKEKKEKEILMKLENIFFDAKGVNALFLSSLETANREKILDKIIELYIKWNRKITTSDLNKWFVNIWKNSTNQNFAGALKFKYISQNKTRPPTFLIYHNKNSKVPKNTKRYIVNKIRDNYSLEGIPIRVNLLSSKNPYIKKS